MPKIINFLSDPSHCPELAQAYDQAISCDSDYLAWWNSCQRGNALAEFALSLEIEEKILIRAICRCVRTVLKFIPLQFQQQSMQVLKTVEAWKNDLASQEEVRAEIDSLRSLAKVCNIDQSERCAIATIMMSSNRDVETTIRFVADTWAIAETKEISRSDDYCNSDRYIKVFNRVNQVCADIIRSEISISVITDRWSKYS
ncbi:hypothetical protein ACQ4M3_17290 [Leptolyngbya sp. AN03gr2]|uniref:hypothetical protein n=1 Tax=unclassified Leptolyngbya TaxID=2650499 RepID=UPI003D311C27